MAAPNTAYTGKKLPVHIYGVAKYDSFFALKLTEYGDQIRGLFYVTHLLTTKNGSDVGFLGAIEDNPNDLFYQLHSTARHSKLRMKNPHNGKVFIVLNDAGLNTKGYVWSNEIMSTVVWNMTVKANFRAAYYEGTSDYGFRVRVRNMANTAWEGWNNYSMQSTSGAIAQRTNQDVTSPGFGGDRRVIQVQGFITNGEGTFYGEISEVYPTAQPWVFYGDSTVYYIDGSEPGIGTKIYTGEDFSGYLQGPSGTGTFGIDQYRYWQYGYDVWTDTYCIIELVDNTPQPPDPTPIQFHYEGYSETSQAGADAQVLGNARQYAGDLWFDLTTERWYTSYSGTSPNFTFSGTPMDGYYADGNVAEITGQLGPLVDGYLQ